MEKLKLNVRVVTPGGTVLMHGDAARLHLSHQDAKLFSRGDEFEVTLKKTKSAEEKTAKKAVPAKKVKK